MFFGYPDKNWSLGSPSWAFPVNTHTWVLLNRTASHAISLKTCFSSSALGNFHGRWLFPQMFTRRAKKFHVISFLFLLSCLFSFSSEIVCQIKGWRFNFDGLKNLSVATGRRSHFLFSSLQGPFRNWESIIICSKRLSLHQLTILLYSTVESANVNKSGTSFDCIMWNLKVGSHTRNIMYYHLMRHIYRDQMTGRANCLNPFVILV